MGAWIYCVSIHCTTSEILAIEIHKLTTEFLINFSEKQNLNAERDGSGPGPSLTDSFARAGHGHASQTLQGRNGKSLANELHEGAEKWTDYTTPEPTTAGTVGAQQTLAKDRVKEHCPVRQQEIMMTLLSGEGSGRGSQKDIKKQEFAGGVGMRDEWREKEEGNPREKQQCDDRQ